MQKPKRKSKPRKPKRQRQRRKQKERGSRLRQRKKRPRNRKRTNTSQRKDLDQKKGPNQRTDLDQGRGEETGTTQSDVTDARDRKTTVGKDGTRRSPVRNQSKVSSPTPQTQTEMTKRSWQTSKKRSKN